MDVKLEQLQSICRTCMSEKEDMKNIFNISDIIMTCATIQVVKDDGLPNTICSDCVYQAHQAYEFRLLCEQSDHMLRKKMFKHLALIKNDRCDSNSSELYQDNIYSPDADSIKIDRKQIHPVTCEEALNSQEDICKNSDKSESENSLTKETRTDTKTKENFPNLDSFLDDYDSDDNYVDVNKRNKSGVLSCRFCDMKFRYRVRLRKHEQKHKNGLKCHLCDKSFTTVKRLTNHVNIHSRKGSHLCQTCGKQFTLPENLVRHQRIHSGIKPYKCNLCNKTFIQSNELKSHVITHSSEKHHLCSVCGNKYSRSISLRVHMRRIHSIPPNHRPYICTVCGRHFKDRRDLSQHMLIHTGERSHVCKVCNKAFNRSSNLRVHERIHTGHKPHVCPICQRAFIQKHVLNTHMRTHPKPT